MSDDTTPAGTCVCGNRLSGADCKAWHIAHPHLADAREYAPRRSRQAKPKTAALIAEVATPKELARLQDVALDGYKARVAELEENAGRRLAELHARHSHSIDLERERDEARRLLDVAVKALTDAETSLNVYEDSEALQTLGDALAAIRAKGDDNGQV